MRRRAIAIAVLLAMCFSMASSAIAATLTQHDVHVTLSTDQSEYPADSDIPVKLTVENQSALPITSVKLMLLNLNGYILSDQSNSVLEIARLDSGSSQTLTAVYQPTGDITQLPQTGDNSNIGMWMFLFCLAFCCLLVNCVRSSQGRKVLSLLLCVICASSFLLHPIAIAESHSVAVENWPQKRAVFARRMAARSQSESIEIHHEVTVEEKTLEIKAVVTFILPGESDNLNDSQVDRGDIENLISQGQIDVVFDETGDIISVDGSFTSKKIKSTNDAAEVLNSASELFGYGFYAEESEITVQTSETSQGNENTYYRYTPEKNNLRVLGSQIVLVVDENGNMKSLTSTYDDKIDEIDRKAEITSAEAENAARKAFLMEEEVQALLSQAMEANPEMLQSKVEEALFELLQIDSELIIYSADDTLPVAAVYAVNIKNRMGIEANDEASNNGLMLPLVSMVYYIYANGTKVGTVHSKVSELHGWTSAVITNKDLLNKNRTFVGQKEDYTYRLKDTTRNLETYHTTYGGTLWTAPQIPGKLVEESTVWGVNFDKVDVSAHANMSEVYDYYKNVLGRNSFDGKGASIRVSTKYDELNLIGSGNYYNAFWTPDYQQFVIGDDGNLAAGLDVLGHEFTHAVVNYVVGNGRNVSLTYQGESGALNESLADIMGTLIEGKTGTGRWDLAEDTDKILRSMSDPSSYGDPEHYDNRYTGANDNGGVHTNSGIFNYAAYKMMTDSETRSISDEIWAKVFYQSMFRLTSDASFLLGRAAVLAAAKDNGFDNEQLQAVRDAFDAVGIEEHKSVRIVLTWGSEPEDLDSHLVGPGVNGGRFHVYYGDPSYYEDGTYSSDSEIYAVDLDYDDVTSYGPEVTTIHKLTAGTYYFYVHDYTTYDSAASMVMAQSGAKVKVYTGSNTTPTATYEITPTKQGTIWNVFKLTIDNRGNMNLSPINTYGNSVTYQ